MRKDDAIKIALESIKKSDKKIEDMRGAIDEYYWRERLVKRRRKAFKEFKLMVKSNLNSF